MERRLVLFLLLAFVIFTGYFSVMQKLYPPKRPQPKDEVAAKNDAEKGEKPKEAEKEKEAAPKEEQEKAAAPEAEKTATAEEKKPGEKIAEEEKKIPEGAAAAEPAPVEEWISLGSADPDDPYRMLCTFTNRGAALARIELSSYREIDDRSGYLGHLVMDKNLPGPGQMVQVVGAGTPAAKAGIKVGDIIKEIDGKPIDSFASLDNENSTAEKLMLGRSEEEKKNVLEHTKPGQTVKIKVLRNGKELTLSATLTRRPLAIVSPENDDPLSFLLTMQQIDDKKIPDDEKDKAVELGRELKGVKLRSTTWEKVEADQTHVVFSKKLPKYNLEIFKTYTLVKVPADKILESDYKAYNLEFSIKIVNTGETAKKVAYRLDGPNGLPTEGWWYANKVSRNWGGAGLRDVVVSFDQNVPSMVGCPTIASDIVGPPWEGHSLTFIGVDAQYFSAVMIPVMEHPNDIWFAASRPLRVGMNDAGRAIQLGKQSYHQNLTNISFRVISLLKELKPGEELSQNFEIFAGPKRPPLLAQYGLSELIYYGWPVFAGPALVMSWILHWFYFVVRNYGLAIILLTVLVRGCMYPLSIKQARSQQKMQELQPEIKRLTEKYKTDMQARSKAQQELFRKHNYNPLGGCLVLLIQLPIFIGLYKSLMYDVELRDEPLICSAVRWCSNLAAPDMLFNWTSFMPEYVTTTGSGIFFLGPFFNILPVLTLVLFIWQQKVMMPPAADEQAATQQKVMKYMMVFMGILFFKVASGLCIYIIATTIWGVCERKFLPKTKPAPGAAPPSKGRKKIKN
ncbi:MAG: membrane protein insertase YidC [Thermoguttaceae bacterium]|jgi:YidC/Oxa1 family membrane protein insertase